jgi:GT2 family glycosyltransferase
MNPIAIVIPTLDHEIGQSTGRLALLHAGECEARVIVSAGPKRGFTKTVNDGVRRSKPDEDICILNDDIQQFYLSWLEHLQRGLYANASYGIAGPSGKSSTQPMAGGHLGMHGLMVVKHIPFWCALVKRAVIDKIGLMDEAFIHYASDNDYCDRARRAGFQCVWVMDSYLRHQQHGSGLIEEWKLHDQRLYGRRKGKR